MEEEGGDVGAGVEVGDAERRVRGVRGPGG